MRRYKHAEVAKIEGVNPRTVSNWNADEFFKRGWRREKDGYAVNYYRLEDGLAAAGESDRSIDKKKKELEIALMEQKLEKTRRMIETEYEEFIMEAVYSLISKVRNAIIKCKLNAEQAGLLQAAMDDALKSCQK
jgi:hypothetical protein